MGFCITNDEWILEQSGNWGGNVDAASVGTFVSFSGYDFRPKNSSTVMGKGIPHPPEVPLDPQHPDAGAYQANDPAPWKAGCTFSAMCAPTLPPPPLPPTPCASPAGAGWSCKRQSYCGPKHSYYHTAQLSLAACSAACVANETGEHRLKKSRFIIEIRRIYNEQ